MPLIDIASALGIEAKHGRSLAPCPGCNADVRGYSSGDRRGPIGLTADTQGWRCHRCDAAGDAIDLVAYSVGQARLGDLDDADKRRVHQFYAERRWCAPLLVMGRGQALTPHRLDLPGSARPSLPRAEIPEPALQRPPSAEIAALWEASAPVDRTMANPQQRASASTRRDPGPLQSHENAAVSADRHPSAPELWPALYLADRGFYAPQAARLDIVRILPLRYPWPHWWPTPWARHYRLVARAFEPNGRLASLHARAVPAYDIDGQKAREPHPKTRWPKGYAAGGLLFANPAGLTLLRGQAPTGLGGVLIVEGLTDLMRAALVIAEASLPLAVLGATSGGFRALAQVRWPDGVKIYAATDPDATGHRYASEVATALMPKPVYRYPIEGRARFTRFKKSEE